MNENKLTPKEIIILLIMIFVPMIIAVIFCKLNNQETINSYVLASYIGETLMLFITIPYLPKNEKKPSERAEQRKRQEKQ